MAVTLGRPGAMLEGNLATFALHLLNNEIVGM
jgi:hypothetical protein